MIYGHFLRLRELREFDEAPDAGVGALEVPEGFERPAPFDVFRIMQRIEWDTLLFFYGIVLSVGGLGALGYLHLMAEWTYSALGPLVANVLIGIVSAVVDNIPVMFAVLNMRPEMAHGHWLLVTLTAGVGGSLLSIGSAAGVALMGEARGVYTFFAHLRWSWAIALGYALSVWTHLLVNASLF
jgi:Na+/H+ antiporter NhaD/arsenite permease-like protein